MLTNSMDKYELSSEKWHDMATLHTSPSCRLCCIAGLEPGIVSNSSSTFHVLRFSSTSVSLVFSYGNSQELQTEELEASWETTTSTICSLSSELCGIGTSTTCSSIHCTRSCGTNLTPSAFSYTIGCCTRFRGTNLTTSTVSSRFSTLAQFARRFAVALVHVGQSDHLDCLF